MPESPNQFLQRPAAFGETDARWAPDASHNPQDLASAFLQHRLALAVEQARLARRPPMSIGDLAKALGEADEGALRRKLTGKRRASIADVLGWAMVLGSGISDELAVRATTLFPPEYDAWAPRWSPGDGLPVFQDPASSLRVLLTESSSELMDRWARLIEAGGSHLLVSESLRHVLVDVFLSRGLDAGNCFIEERKAVPALIVGALHAAVIITYCSQPGATTPAAVRTEVTRAANALVAASGGPEGGRYAVLALSAPVWSALRANLPEFASADIGSRFALAWEHLAQVLPDAPGDLQGELLAGGSWPTGRLFVLTCDKVVPAP